MWTSGYFPSTFLTLTNCDGKHGFSHFSNGPLEALAAVLPLDPCFHHVAAALRGCLQFVCNGWCRP